MLDVTYESRGDRDPPCSGCGKSLGVRVSTVFQQGEMFHVRCWAIQLLQATARDQQDRARLLRARAVALTAMSRRLLDRVSEEFQRRAARPPVAPPASLTPARTPGGVAPSPVDFGNVHGPP